MPLCYDVINGPVLLQVFLPVLSTFGIEDADEKAAARKALCAPDGPVTKRMNYVDKIVGAATTDFFCGDQPTLADYSLFVFLSNLRTGCDMPCSVVLKCIREGAGCLILSRVSYMLGQQCLREWSAVVTPVFTLMWKLGAKTPSWPQL